MSAFLTSGGASAPSAVRALPRAARAAGAALVAGLAASLVAACGQGERPPPADDTRLGWLEARGTSPSAQPAAQCAPGAAQECGVKLEQEGGIVTCYRGVQHCEGDGRWGECMDGEVTREPDPTSALYAGFARPLALSSVEPVACSEPCDPACMLFVESGPLLGGGSGSSGSGAGCSHDACTVDPAPLDASCGSCVATVCGLDSTCCTTDWDATCVNLAYTACENRLPPLGLCDFGVFSLQSLTTANRPSAGASIGSRGDVTIGTDATPSTIVALGNLSIMSPNGKHVSTPGGVWVGGSVTAQNGGGAQYTGDWNVGGGIDLSGNNTINGTVRARQNIRNLAINGPAYAGGSFSSVTGTGSRTAGSTHPAPVLEIPTAIPTRSVSCPGTVDKTINAGTTVTLAPGNYRDVTLQNGNASNPSVLILSPGGKYTFRNLTITSGCQYCRIQLGTSSAQGPWDVSVCGRALLEGPNSFIAGHDKAKLTQPEKLVLYVHGTDPGAWQYAAKLGNDFKFVGVLMVPNGSFRSEDRATVNGAVWAKAVSAGTDLAATQISRAACEGLNLPGTVPEITSCPIETIVAPPVTLDEYTYQAECPSDTRARWKNLTWSSAVPSGSSVAFGVKVASELAELEEQTYTPVGTAQNGTPNTQVCSLFGPSPVCPVALTDQLGLGYNQGQYLSLSVEADSTGGAPAVSDWKLSYTCQFAE